MTDATPEQIRRFLEKPENAEVAVEVHRHWPDVRAGIERQFVERLAKRIREHLERVAAPSWAISPPSERLRLYRSNHWSTIAFSGVWSMWGGNTFEVGVEWPKKGVTSLYERVQKCFEKAGVKVSRPKSGGGDRERGGQTRRPETWWLSGSPNAEDWNWERLGSKSDYELDDYAAVIVTLMRALTDAIDDAEGHGG